MVGPTDVVQPPVPRAARARAACLWHVPICLSLAVIAATLAITAVLSLRAEPKVKTPA